MKSVLSVFGVESSRISGIEIYARELSRQLGERGWESVICFHNDVPDLVRSYFDLPNVALDSVPDCWKTGLQPARDMLRALRRYRPAILHLHYCGFLGIHPWLARLCSPVEEIFLTDHTSRPEGFQIRRAPPWKRLLARGINYPVTGVVCVSDYGWRCNTGAGLLPAERFRRIYNGVTDAPAPDGDFRRTYCIPRDRRLVVQLSWMIPEKGVQDLLEAAALVIARDPEVHFAMVGDGAGRRAFIDRARELGIAAHVTFTGNIRNPLKEGVHSAADVICQVSRWEEVFGFTIAEAMMHGKPVLATRVGGIPELVEDGRTGFLVERGDAAAMADRLLALLRDPDLRERMGREGRRVAREKFELRKNVGELLDWYGIQP